MKHAPRARRDKQAGVALLEVLISVLLFSFGILGLIGLQARAISASVDAEDRNRAALLANEIASVMWLNRTVVVPADALLAWQTRVADPSVLPGGQGTVSRIGTTNSADVRISWRARTRTEDSLLTTRVTVNLP